MAPHQYQTELKLKKAQAGKLFYSMHKMVDIPNVSTDNVNHVCDCLQTLPKHVLIADQYQLSTHQLVEPNGYIQSLDIIDKMLNCKDLEFDSLANIYKTIADLISKGVNLPGDDNAIKKTLICFEKACIHPKNDTDLLKTAFKILPKIAEVSSDSGIDFIQKTIDRLCQKYPSEKMVRKLFTQKQHIQSVKEMRKQKQFIYNLSCQTKSNGR